MAKPGEGTSETSPRAWLAWLIYEAGITQAEAAGLIAKHTGRPCSVCSVRAWLASPGLESASHCPEWAVTALRRKLIAVRKLPG